LKITNGCDTSTTAAEITVRNLKLPPGGGRAAGGGSARRKRQGTPLQPSQSKRAKWLAVVVLPGAEQRFAVQCGRAVTYVDGSTTLADVLHFVASQGGRAGDET